MSLNKPSRLLILVVAALASAICVIFYGGEQVLALVGVLLLEGLVQLAYFAACFVIGRPFLKRLAPSTCNTVFGIVTSTALGFGLVGFLTLALGLAGWLTTPSAWAMLLIPTAVAAFDLRDLTKHNSALGEALRRPSSGSWLWVVGAFLLTIPAIGAALPPGFLWRPDDPHPYDVLLYHLQVPREWFEAGRITGLHHNVYSYFPFNLEMHFLLANLLRGGSREAMYQCQYFSLSLTLLAGLGLWGWVRHRFPPAAAAVAALAVWMLPWSLMLACVAYNESAMLLFGMLAAGWFFTALGSEKPVREALLAGIFCGLAAGTKLTGVPMLLLGLPAAGVIAGGLHHLKKTTTISIVVVVAGSASLSPWLIRNTAWTGNPVFPLEMPLLGKAHFTDVQVERWERAHQPAAAHKAWSVRFDRSIAQIALNWRFAYIFFPLAIAGAALAWRRSDARAAILLILLMLAFWLLTTHLMGRFFVLAIVPAAFLIGMLPGHWLTAARILIPLAGIYCYIGPNLLMDDLSKSQNVHQLFDWYARFGRSGAYGLAKYSIIDPPELRAMLDKPGEIVMVGDVQVFSKEPGERGHLVYRSVFDLVTDNRDPIDIYYGPAGTKCPPDANIIMDLGECRRLSRTYFDVPKAEPPPDGRYRSLFVIGD
jgi:hypothetical protein